MKQKKFTAALAAVFIAAALPVSSMAAIGPESGTEEDFEKQQKLNDSVLEYGEIADRVENYNADYKKTNSMLVNNLQNLEAARQLGKDANDLMEEAEDLRYEGMTKEDRVVYDGYKTAAKELRKEAQKITNADLGASNERTLRQVKNQITAGVQQLMMKYQQTLAQKEVVEKQLELVTASLEASRRMSETGMKSYEDVLASERDLKQLETAKAQLDAGLLNMKQNLLIMTGYNTEIEIGAIPEPDLNRIASMNPETDYQDAMGANYGLQTIKRQSAKGTVSRGVKQRSVSQSEQSLASTLQSLYASVLSKKESYDAAGAAYDAAVLTMNMMERKNSMGMLGKMEYLKAEADFLTAKAAKTSADIDLFQAMETYDWAVKGLVLTGAGGK